MDLNSLLTTMENNTTTLTFYNPAISALGTSVSVMRGTVQLTVAEPYDKTNRGFAKPNEKRFDWPNSIVFSLIPVECYDICKNFDALVKGEYKRTVDNYGKPVEEKYQNTMTFQHQTRKMFIGPIDSKMDGGIKSLRIGIFDGEKGKAINYIFRENELFLFKKFLENSVTMLPFLTSFLMGAGKLIKSSLYKMNNNGNDSVNYQQPPEDNFDIDINMGNNNVKEEKTSSNEFGNIFDEEPKQETKEKSSVNSLDSLDFEF